MISQEVELVLEMANREAERLGNEFITLEHILYAVTFNDLGKDVLEACDIRPDDLAAELEEGSK